MPAIPWRVWAVVVLEHDAASLELGDRALEAFTGVLMVLHRELPEPHRIVRSTGNSRCKG
jgi:hypothetical protein